MTTATDLRPPSPPSTIEQSILLRELDQHLASAGTDRDRTIFWLYYRQGYTAKDIASMPGLGLTQKGVESCIYRLTQALRGSVSNMASGLKKGSGPQTALGGMK